MDETRDLGSIPIINRLPSLFNQQIKTEFPNILIGSRIVAIGTPVDEWAVEGGGLIMDFVPDGETDIHRIVFGFSELGMWIEYPNANQSGMNGVE